MAKIKIIGSKKTKQEEEEEEERKKESFTTNEEPIQLYDFTFESSFLNKAKNR